ncbi:hypothetical protein ACP275_06G133300 [Erythranthe tilingii]
MTTRRPPKWLPPWLNLKFYRENCKKHVNRYCTIYCGVCMCEPFCDTCWKEKSKEHKNHDQILKVCIASDRAAIKRSDMEKYWDVADIQRYKINGKVIFHLKSKHSGGTKTKSTTKPKSKHHDALCLTCKSKLISRDYSFCSIACKANKNNDVDQEKANIEPGTPPLTETEDKKTTVNEESKKRKSIEADTKSSQAVEKISMRKRSRKGVPQRAPLKAT